MSFLNKLWKELKNKKSSQTVNPDIEFKKVYDGYRTIPIQTLERKAPYSPSKQGGKSIWQEENGKTFTYMQNQPLTHLSDNGFFDCFIEAYLKHGDVKIKPDQVWNIIMLWFTKYVNDNAENLRKAFVSHSGKKQLKVQTDRNLKDWSVFLELTIEQIRKNTSQKVTQHLSSNFSSTSTFDRYFSIAIIMNTFKKYFDYTRQGGGCGILNIHMGGSLQDWQLLEEKLVYLTKFDVDGELKRYVSGLKPVLEQFTETYKGFANIQFWNNIHQYRQIPEAMAYEPLYKIEGWIIKFFTTANVLTEDVILEKFEVPVKYIDLVTKKVQHFKILGGCLGYSVQDKCVFTPHYSLAVVQKIDQKMLKLMKTRKIQTYEEEVEDHTWRRPLKTEKMLYIQPRTVEKHEKKLDPYHLKNISMTFDSKIPPKKQQNFIIRVKPNLRKLSKFADRNK